MSKHPDPSYWVAMNFMKTVYIITAVAYVIVILVGIFVFHFF